MTDLSIGEVASRSGVEVATIRAWEARHGFPEPRRLPSGHRRYAEADVDLVAKVAQARRNGAALSDAIDSVLRFAAGPNVSLFARLRSHWGLAATPLLKPMLSELTYSIEDEVSARADTKLLFGSFQMERHYRSAQPRWENLAQEARFAAVWAEFGHTANRSGCPVELDIAASDPLAREWSVVAHGPTVAVCLSARERPPQSGGGGRRTFETVWTVDPRIVGDVVDRCLERAATQCTLPAMAQRDVDPGDQAALEFGASVSVRLLTRLGQSV